ncbi:unnamed protein product [Lepeophtheirus salmonis]|uniref:(salmon louse) hypothetical protein n=1 Tax=Lepeophtheirus salmonis TaxID=72036 RepID=A0A7R8CLF8_LEPSM|nr:unnamed protein product [Lepeophtheirus salmonis]CAF2854998.1 unnamed protein product [Lepeophtheirus salmonis]
MLLKYIGHTTSFSSAIGPTATAPLTDSFVEGSSPILYQHLDAVFVSVLISWASIPALASLVKNKFTPNTELPSFELVRYSFILRRREFNLNKGTRQSATSFQCFLATDALENWYREGVKLPSSLDPCLRIVGRRPAISKGGGCDTPKMALTCFHQCNRCNFLSISYRRDISNQNLSCFMIREVTNPPFSCPPAAPYTRQVWKETFGSEPG